MSKSSWTFYEIWNDPDIIFAVNRQQDIFKLWIDGDGNPGDWNFLEPDGQPWNMAHQEIFRNHNVNKVDFQKRGLVLPEVPVPPSRERATAPLEDGKRDESDSRIVRAGGVGAERYPLARDMISTAGGDGLTLHVILKEDGYESSFGDGVYRYFHKVFLDQCDARRRMENESPDWTRYSHRVLQLVVEGGQIKPRSCTDSWADSFSLSEVLADFETTLSLRPSDADGRN